MSCVSVCSCNVSMGNTGYGCILLTKVARKLLFFPMTDSTGAPNYINLATTLNQAYFTALINQADASKRLYPSPNLYNVDNKRADAITEKFGDNTESYVMDGVRVFQAVMKDQAASPKMAGNLNKIRCGEMGVIVVDKDGNLYGVPSSDKTRMYPVQIDSGSFSAMMEEATDTTVRKLAIKFNFSPDEKDECIGYIALTDMASDVTPLKWKGLVDVYVQFTTVGSTTGVTVKAYTDFGTPMNPVTVKGLLVTDFVSYYTGVASKVRNNTTSGDITLSSATETPANSGIYVLVWTPAQTSANKIVVAINKTGYDSLPTNATEFAVP